MESRGGGSKIRLKGRKDVWEWSPERWTEGSGRKEEMRDEQRIDGYMFDEIKDSKATEREKESDWGQNTESHGISKTKRRNVPALSQVCGLNTYLKVMAPLLTIQAFFRKSSAICQSRSPAFRWISPLLFHLLPVLFHPCWTGKKTHLKPIT